jgi:amino acid adenylation domain-containing protein
VNPQVLEYWTHALRGVSPALAALADIPRPPAQSFLRERETVSLDAQRMPDEMSALLSLFALMHRYTQHEDIVLGVLLGDEPPGVASRRGLLPLRVAVAPDATAAELRERLRSGLSEVQSKATGFDLEAVAAVVDPGLHADRNAIFQVAFGAIDGRQRGAAWQAAALEEAFEAGKRCDLVFVLHRAEATVTLVCEYDSELFEPASVQRVVRQWATLMEGVEEQIQRCVHQLAFLPASERARIIEQWSIGASLARPAATLHGLVEEHARRQPGAPAVTFRGRTMTYAQLEAEANRVCRYLIGRGLSKGDIVATCLRRSDRLPSVLYGALKAGAAYMPLEPSDPKERLRFMVEDASVKLVVCDDESVAGLFVGGPSAVVQLDRDWSQIQHQLGTPVPEAGSPDGLAYVIYTSGTTGRPKGVMIEHRAICNRLLHDGVRIGAEDSVLQKTPLTFDVAVWDLWFPLVHGARLVMATPDGHRDTRYLIDTIVDENVSTIHFVPSMLRAFLNEPEVGRCTSLAHVTCSGESLPADVMRDFFERLPGVALYNYYGPTEAAVDVTYWRCRPDWNGLHVPIGRPIENVSVYVLDTSLRPVPVGIPGELYIGGVCLARGYINRPDAEKRFIPDPLHPQQRLYATGDRVCWLADGSLEFRGRLDHQLKIHGFRIEAGEVEAALRSFPGVFDAVAVGKRLAGATSDLVAYVVPHQGRALDVDDVRQHVRARLPVYMVPARIVTLDTLPRTSSGKIDRGRLPDPGAVIDRSSPPSEPAVAAHAEAVLRVWQKVLRRQHIGTSENFFDLGGNSFLLVEVHAELERALGRQIARTDFFRYPTVETLAAALSRAGTSPAHPVTSAASSAESGRFAVVGMACRVPGASSLDEFWALIRDGRRGIRALERGELLEAGEDPKRMERPEYVAAGAVLEDIAGFDAELFGFAPRECELTDPQQRILLECAWEALEHGGYGMAKHRPRCGVFVGSLPSAYFQRYLASSFRDVPTVTQYQIKIGNEPDFLPTVIAYKLDLKGPAMAVQTACSTSLVAVHMACNSLRLGECDMAVAGGVSVRVPQIAGYLHQEGMVQSSDGHCRAFDDQASGTIFGNGCGVVVVKRLEDAVRDRDRIYAVIRGSAINNDGALKVGYTAPSVEGQVAVIRQAQEKAAIGADEIAYVEAHGTGTRLGDPVEVAALTEAFAASSARSGFCALGSVKANIGHLDAASGIAGLIKTVLALDHGIIPRATDVSVPSRQIDWARSPFFLPRESSSWPSAARRIAAVSSFGIGGTNAHMLLEAARAPTCAGPARDGLRLLKLSARSCVALQALVERYLQFLRANREVSLDDLCYTASVGRADHAHRLCVLARSTEQVTAALRAFAEGQPAIDLFVGDGVVASAQESLGVVVAHGLPPTAADLSRLSEASTAFSRAAAEELGCDVAPQGWLERPAETLAPIAHQTLLRMWRACGVTPRVVLDSGAAESAADAEAALKAAKDGGLDRVLVLATDASSLSRVRLACDRVALECTPCVFGGAHGPRNLLVAAAKLYVSGAEVDLSAMDVNTSGRRIELPTYPFQRKPYWPDAVAAAEPSGQRERFERTASMLGRRLQLPQSKEVRFEAVFDRTHPAYVDHHRLFGTMVVPGASHIAMVVAAAEQMGLTPCTLHDVLFLQPFAISEQGARRAQLVLTPEGDQWAFKLLAQGEGADDRLDEWSTLFSGRLRREPSPRKCGLSEEARAQIRARCATFLPGRSFYTDVWVPGLDTGESFHWIDSIWRGDSEALCRTGLPQIQLGDEPLHAGLVEAAFQLLNSCWKYDTAALRRSGDIYVPFSIAEYRFHKRPASDKLWVHARLEGHESASDDAFTAHVDMFDEAGEPVVEVRAFQSRKIQRARVEHALTHSGREPAYEMRWQRSDIVGLRSAHRPCAIILGGASDLERLSSALRRRGVDPIEMNAAERGRGLAQRVQPGRTCLGVIDLRPLQLSAEGAGHALMQRAAESCAAALALLREVRDADTGLEKRVLWVTAGAQAVTSAEDVENPFAATLWGLLAAVRHECPEVTCVSVDLPSRGETSFDDVVAELLSEAVEPRVAWRLGARHVARLARLAEPLQEAPPIRRDGCYLVTGGMRGVGLLVAEWLAQQGAGRVILISRSPADSQVAAAAARMQAHRCHVTTLQCDIASPGAVQRVSATLAEGAAPLRGIVHAAGVLDDGAIDQLDAARFADVFAPKVAGMLHLHEVARTAPLDFFACFSSMTATLGAAGQGNYAAANAFLDAFAHHRRARGLPATSFGWGPWAEVGMAARLKDRDKQHARDRGLHSLTPDEGCRLFGRYLHASSAALLPAQIDWSRYAVANVAASDPLFMALRPRDVQSSAGGAKQDLRQVLESALVGERSERARALIAQQVRLVLGLSAGETVDPERGFVDLGLDSLTVVELRSRLQAGFGLRLSPTFGFDHPNVAAAADYVIGALFGAERPSGVERRPERDGAVEAELALLEQALRARTP